MNPTDRISPISFYNVARRHPAAAWRAARRALPVCALACVLALIAASAGAQSAAAAAAEGTAPRAPLSAGISPAEAQTLDMLLELLPGRYTSAHASHDPASAASVRLIARAVRDRVRDARSQLVAQAPDAAERATGALDRLATALAPTARRFATWPLTYEIDALSATARGELRSILATPAAPAHPFDRFDSALSRVRDATPGSRTQQFALLHAYALYALNAGRRLQLEDPALDAQITGDLLVGSPADPALAQLLADRAPAGELAKAETHASADLGVAAQVLGLVKISQATIVVNGAIIVFREGLEAVLILAAITASFVGVRRRLRRPVLIGAAAGLAATALTWIVAQLLLHLLGNGGLELQAVTGLIAIAVLLLVTNWFFHRVYWSEWISRFNRRRKAIERWDRLGFISGQVLGLLLLGLSSVYREGLETVLFLQALQTSAGTGATALGAGIGLGATLLVGAITFKLQRKLPFKRMLILTGVLIALVLAVMVGTTIHTMQGIGWIPITTTSFQISTDWSTWLGVYPTWEGIGAQLGAMVFVLGSYFAAREIQINRPRRRALRREEPGPVPRAAGGPAGAAAAAPSQRAV
jgi:high-affinity iron transporter